MSTKVEFIGRKPSHRDRLYGTDVTWDGPGDVQDVGDAVLAERMATLHPDIYRVTSGSGKTHPAAQADNASSVDLDAVRKAQEAAIRNKATAEMVDGEGNLTLEAKIAAVEQAGEDRDALNDLSEEFLGRSVPYFARKKAETIRTEIIDGLKSLGE